MLCFQFPILTFSNQEYKIHLQVKNWFYVSCDESENYTLNIRRSEAGSWETFHLIKSDHGSFQLRYKNKYVGCLNNDSIVLAHDDIHDFYFKAINLSPGKKVLKTAQNKYVGISEFSLFCTTDSLKATPFYIKEKMAIGLSPLPNRSLVFLISSLIFIAFSVYFFINNTSLYALVFLIIGGFLLRCFMITLNDFLWLWDEQYHALVAKNLIGNPLKPVLVKNPVLTYDIGTWTNNHVWLHKFPAFLWPMAMSIKTFGLEAWAVRLPSVIFSTFCIYLLYDIGSMLMCKKRAYISALMYTVSIFGLELVSGFYGMDHNDTAFFCFVTASYWAYVKYIHTKYLYKWALMSGIFIGLAVLTKWLMGFLVFIPWSINLLWIDIKNKTAWKHIISSFIISAIISGAWILYIFTVYPFEANFEFSQMAKHFNEVIEGHSGTITYHFEKMTTLYNVHYLVIISMVAIFIYSLHEKRHKIFTSVIFVFCYVFFSISSTKLPAYPYIVGSIVIISISNTLYMGLKILEKSSPNILITKIILFVALGGITWYFLDFNKIQNNHVYQKHSASENILQQEKLKLIYEGFSNEKFSNTILINCPKYHMASCMFFSNVYVAYDFIPTNEELHEILSMEKKVICFEFEKQPIPEYISKNPNIEIMDINAAFYPNELKQLQ